MYTITRDVLLKAPMISNESRYPLDLITTGFLNDDQCKGGIGNILVSTYHLQYPHIIRPLRLLLIYYLITLFLNMVYLPGYYQTRAPTSSQMLSEKCANF